MRRRREVWYLLVCLFREDDTEPVSSNTMPIRHFKDVIGEAGSLGAYAVCSVVGSVVHPGHHPHGNRRPVVLVPGFLGRGLAFVRLKGALARKGYPVYVADLGYGVGCIRDKARHLEEFVDDQGLEDYYAVGHSMGGIISLAMSEPARNRVRHFITLGTAFKGAVLSYLLPFLPAARQLNPDSPILRTVARRAREHDNVTPVVAKWDEIALPMESCYIENCQCVTGVAGHVQLIMRSSSFRQLSELLEDLESGQ